MATDEAKAISDIVSLIKQGRIDPEVKRITGEVILQSGVRFGDDVGELRAIYEWVGGEAHDGRVRYIRDPYGRDVYQSALDTLEKFKTGDCEDLTILIASMVLSIGYPIALKLASIDGEIWDHIYSLAGLPPEAPIKWVAMDTTLANGRLGLEPERVTEKFLRLANGVVTEEGTVFIPSQTWQQRLYGWVPLIILAPVAVHLVTKGMGGR